MRVSLVLKRKMAAGRKKKTDFSFVLKRKMAAGRKKNCFFACRNQIPVPLASQPTRPANQPTSQILTFCQPARPANQPTSQPANQPSRPPAYLGRLVHRGGGLFLSEPKCKTPPFFDEFRLGLFKKNMFFAFWRLFYIIF